MKGLRSEVFRKRKKVKKKKKKRLLSLKYKEYSIKRKGVMYFKGNL